MVLPTSLDFSNQNDYIFVLKEFKDDLVYDTNEILKDFLKSVNSLYQLKSFEKLEEIFPSEYTLFIKDKSLFIDRLHDIVSDEASESDDSYLEDKLEEIKSVSQKYGISTDSAEEKIQEKIDEKNQRDEESYNWDDERSTGNLESDNQDLQIESMFDSLRDTERLSD